MPLSFGRGYLGELGRRLQRLLGFDGEPNADFDSRAIPVLICGDGTLPGYGDQSGRRWVCYAGVIAAGNMLWLRATADVIVEAIVATRSTLGAGASDINFRVAPVGTADPFALDGTFNFFLDRNVGTGDKPPVLSQAGATAVAGTFTIFQRDMLASDSEVICRAAPFCLQTGQAVLVNNFPAGGTVVTIYGRTL